MSAIIEHNVPLQKVICDECKNKMPDLKCKAFDRIPNDIIFGRNDHSKPLPGQKNDIVFEHNGKE